jgi:hypothetical protein
MQCGFLKKYDAFKNHTLHTEKASAGIITIPSDNQNESEDKQKSNKKQKIK